MKYSHHGQQVDELDKLILREVTLCGDVWYHCRAACVGVGRDLARAILDAHRHTLQPNATAILAKMKVDLTTTTGDKGKTRIRIKRTRARPATATNKANARIRMKTTRAMLVTATIARAGPVIA